MQIIRAADFHRVPWNNGAGITFDIALSNPDQPFWRLSLAEMPTSAAFSKFAGLSRNLTVVRGNGLILTSPDCSIEVLPETPVAFSGDKVIIGQLVNGPVQNFNLVFDGEKFSASVLMKKQAGLIVFPKSYLNAVYLLSGHAKIMDKMINAGDAMIGCNNSYSLNLSQDAKAILVSLQI